MRAVNIEDPEKLDKAADAAREDGDYEHEKLLRERAQIARRRAREASVGLRPAWNFPKSWM